MVGSGSAQWWHYSVGESVEIISCVIWPAAIRSQLSALLWSHQSGHPAYHTNPLSANNFYNFEQKSQFWSSLPREFGRFSYYGWFGRFGPTTQWLQTTANFLQYALKLCQLYRQISIYIDFLLKFITKNKILMFIYSMRCYVVDEEKRMNESPLETRPHQGPA